MVRRRGPGAPLLLVAPDEHSADALRRALSRWAVQHENMGPLFLVRGAEEQTWALVERLCAEETPALRSRVRCAWCYESDSAEARIASCAAAEPLTDALERRDAEWLRPALVEGWLYSVFQAVVDARTGRPYGYEALVRAREPGTDEVLSAGQLLYCASRLGLRHSFEMSAARSALEGARAFGLHETNLFLNIAPSALYDGAFALERLLERARERGVDPSRLVFEVIDFDEETDPHPLARWIAACRESGARVALDDVSGTDRALDLVRLLAPDFVKTDRWLAPSSPDSRSRKRLDRMVALADEVGFEIVVEGVETPAQARMCVEAGAHLLQGFLFGLPSAPPGEVFMDPAQLSQAA